MKKVGKSSKKGFTLVELIVVIVILAILAAMLVPALIGYIDRAKKEKDYQAASTLYAAAQATLTEQYGKGEIASKDAVTSISKDQYKVTVGSEKVDAAIDLAGIDPDKIDSYTFYCTNLVITWGEVTIKNGASSATGTTYYMYSDGTWGPDAYDAATGNKVS